MGRGEARAVEQTDDTHLAMHAHSPVQKQSCSLRSAPAAAEAGVAIGVATSRASRVAAKGRAMAAAGRIGCNKRKHRDLITNWDWHFHLAVVRPGPRLIETLSRRHGALEGREQQPDEDDGLASLAFTQPHRTGAGPGAMRRCTALFRDDKEV